jgi:hypothetical protein
MAAAVHALRSAAGRPLRRIQIRRLESDRFRMRLMAGEVAADGVPLVICLWDRPDRLPVILEHLARQQVDRPLRVIFWNNKRSHSRYNRGLLQGRDLPPHLAGIEYVDSFFNVGGIARFYLMRRLRRSGYQGPVLILDDDQDIDAVFMQTLIDEHRPRSIHSVWAFKQHGSYWNRTELAPGELADYAGTGGSVVDASLVDERRFFTALPDEYRFLEDMWMDYVAVQGEWTLHKSGASFEFVQEEKNQYLRLRTLKDEFREYLDSETAAQRWAAAPRD